MSMAMGTEATIQEYIQSYNTDDIKSSSFFLKEVFTNQNGTRRLVINQSNILVKYMQELNADLVKVSFSDTEYQQYKYNPKRLSYDLFGTTELWFLILEINELHSINQFDLRTINLFSPIIIDRLSRVLDLEKSVIDYNDDKITEATK